MPPKYHESVRKAVEDLLRAGVRIIDIERDLRVSHQWVSDLRKLIEALY
jgi:hypothetical protein